MKRRGLTLGGLMGVSVVLFAAGATVYSQLEYKLAYRWDPGRKFSHAIYVVGKVQTSGAAVREVKLQYQAVWEVAEADPKEDRYLVTETVKNYLGPELDLRSFDVPPPGETIRRSLDSCGRVLSVQGYAQGSRFHLLPLVFVPGLSVAGDNPKWQLTGKLLAPLGEVEVETTAEMEYSLEKVLTNYKNRSHYCALVRLGGKYTYRSEDGDRELEGTIQGRVFFDLVEQMVVDYQLEDHRQEGIKSKDWTRATTLEITALEQK